MSDDLNPLVTLHRLDFTSIGLSEYATPTPRLALIIDNLFSVSDCASILKQAEDSQEWDLTQIYGSQNFKTLPAEPHRSSGRILLYSKELADSVFNRIRPYLRDFNIETLPSTKLKQKFPGKTVSLRGFNERLSFLRYGPGQYFKEHCDGICVVTREEDGKKEISYFTLQLYLGRDDGSTDQVEGGATRFWGKDKGEGEGEGQRAYFDVEPKVGRVLIFEQQGLLHSGEEITKGLKYSMRADIMYM